MNKKELRQALRSVLKIVHEEMAGQARHGHIAGGLSPEGYAGGYSQAIGDVLFLLGPTCTPDMLSNQRYWNQLPRTTQNSRKVVTKVAHQTSKYRQEVSASGTE